MDTGTLVAILALAVTIIGGGTAWVLRFGKIEAAVERSEAAEAKVQEIQRELVEFKVEVARNYATAAMVAQVERGVGEAINRLSDRLDKVLALIAERGNTGSTL